MWVCFSLTAYWTKQHVQEVNPERGSMFRSVQVQACKRSESTPAPDFLCCYFHHFPIYNRFKLEVKSSRMCRNFELGWWNRPELSSFRPGVSVLLLSHVGLNRFCFVIRVNSSVYFPVWNFCKIFFVFSFFFFSVYVNIFITKTGVIFTVPFHQGGHVTAGIYLSVCLSLWFQNNSEIDELIFMKFSAKIFIMCHRTIFLLLKLSLKYVFTSSLNCLHGILEQQSHALAVGHQLHSQPYFSTLLSSFQFYSQHFDFILDISTLFDY